MSPTSPSRGDPLWQPLQVAVFRAVWTASLFSHIGTLMHQVGAAWLMTSLTESPVLVGLLQTAGALPMFLVGLPAGVLADLVPRRTMLLITQGWMLLVSAVIALVTGFGWMQPWLLLVLTFSLGLGSALSLPSWQATVPDLVPREMLGAAISLNSIGFNTARSFGPALGGLIVAAAGPEAVFVLNTVSFVGIIVVFSWWRPPKRKRKTTEDVFGALRAGIRYVLNSPPLHAPLVRVAGFMLCASVVMALLPLLAREVWQMESLGYGSLLAAFGVGSIVSASLVPRLRERLPVDVLTGIATFIGAVVLLVLGWTQSPWVAGISMFGWGLCWTGTLVNCNVAMQMGVAGWVRGRAMAVYLLTFMGCMALGSFLWGTVAAETSPQAAMLLAGCGLILGLLLIVRWRLGSGEQLDLRPSPVFVENEHHVVAPADAEEGPVLVTIEYRVDSNDENAFRELMTGMRKLRKRDGATVWRLYRDTIDPMKFIEIYRVDTWAEHMRQRERMTVSDTELYHAVRELHAGDQPPHVSHFINVLS